MPAGHLRRVPAATVERLAVYSRALSLMEAGGQVMVSSIELAHAAGAGAANVRRDLSYLGSLGTRGAGYDVAYLGARVRDALGEDQEWRVVIVGAGNLGTALAGAPTFSPRGFAVSALIDSDPAAIGRRVGAVAVSAASTMEDHLRKGPDRVIAVIATPSHAAQEVADRLVAAGVVSILNFAPVRLAVPSDVLVRNVDLSTELAVLSFHAMRNAGPYTVRHVDRLTRGLGKAGWASE